MIQFWTTVDPKKIFWALFGEFFVVRSVQGRGAGVVFDGLLFTMASDFSARWTSPRATCARTTLVLGSLRAVPPPLWRFTRTRVGYYWR